jgi:hypothetical protein
MMGATGPSDGRSLRRQWVNLFEILNREELAIEYRLVEVRGLPPGEHYDKNVNKLAKAVAYEIRQPVSLVRRAGDCYLAIPAEAALSKFEYQLMPHAASLIPEDKTHPLELAQLDPTTAPIAVAFLTYAARTTLWRNKDLWGGGRVYYRKQPVNAGDPRALVDVYSGFAWNVVIQDGGRLFLAVDKVARYVDRRWLPERLHGDDPRMYLRRYCLYHFGHKWYVVQFVGLSGLSIAQQRFRPEGDDRVTDVLSYTKEDCGETIPPWVRDLDPDSPAIIYRYPGNDKERYGALALCKLALPTSDDEVAGLHGHSILDPAKRFRLITDAVSRYFQGGRLCGRPVRIAAAPLEIPRRIFPVPPLRFGQGRVLAVQPGAPFDATDRVPLRRLGQRRLELVLDPQAGPLEVSPFDAQYVFLPRSLPRPINEDFERRFVQTMREVSGQQTYQVRRILYDDRQAGSLYRQVQAIKQVVAENDIRRGYALLVLLERAKRDLHNYIKREFWPDLQFQCAMASKIRSYYKTAGVDAPVPAPERAGKYQSYVRNCTFGMMVVNRKWLCALATPLHYDVYIGIDVLNGMAGLTFVYNRGEQIFFHNYPCKYKERLTMPQLREILLRHLPEDLKRLGLHPASMVLLRDGRTWPSELEAWHAVVRELRRGEILPPDGFVGVVDIRKSTADHLRLVEGETLETVENPTLGSYHVSMPTEGIVCTTGWPFRFPGTAKPLAAVIVEGALNVEWILEDLFALSQPVHSAPDKCARLPLPIKLNDDFLEPIAGEADEEAALYETESPEDYEGVETSEPVAPETEPGPAIPD